MPLIEHLLGDIEIQERRPKSWMEPRRKRLSFVRPHDPGHNHSRHSSSSSNPDDWALVPARGNAQYFRNEAETWDLRRHEAQARFNDADIRHRDLEHRQRVHYIHQLYGPPPDLQRIHDHGHEQGLLEGGGIQTIRPRAHHGDSDDEIVEILSVGGDDGWDDHHHHQRVPLSIEQDRDHGRALRDLMGRDSKRGKSKDKGKKGGDKKKGKGKGKGKSHSDSDSSDDERKVFMEGVKAGIRASRERGASRHGGGGGSDRGSPRTRRRFVRNDDSDDSMDFRPRRRSRSRGRLGWGL